MTALLLLLLLPATRCFAFSYRAMTEAEMTHAADVIVVGTHRIRDTEQRHVRTLHVDEVLKGDGLAAGTEVNVSASLMRMELAPEPRHRDEQVIAWLRKGTGGYWLLNFTNSLKEPTPDRRKSVQQVLAVLAQPAAHFPPADDQAAEALCLWVADAWFTSELPPSQRRVPKKGVPQVAGVKYRQVVDLLRGLAAKDKSPSRQRALGLLVELADPAAFDTFVAAFGADDPNVQATAARGLRALRDKRALPHLLKFLDTVEYESPALQPVCEAVAEIGDPAAVPALLRHLRQQRYGGPPEALGRLRDPRAVPALLEAVWRDEYLVDSLLAFDDPSILAEARRRTFDHPQAPVILARLGDAGAERLMLTLIRQRNAAGLVWAAKTRDPDAIPVIIKAMRDGWPSQFVIDGMRVLADVEDPRAVGAVATLLTSPGYGGYALEDLEKRLQLAGGKERRPAGRTRALAASLLDGADRYRLNPRTRKWAENEVKRKDDAAAAYGLPAWPEMSSGGVSVDELKAFAERHRETLARFVRDETVPAQQRLDALAPAQFAGVTLLDERDVDWLLAAPEPGFHRHVLDQYQSGRIKLDRSQVRQFLTSPVLPVYLHFVANAKSCEYPEVLEEVVQTDWGPGVPELFEAIAAVRLKSAVPRLRSLLDGQVIDVRRNAAVALAHLDDDSGREVLEREVARYRRQKYQHHTWGSDAEKALQLLRQRAR